MEIKGTIQRSAVKDFGILFLILALATIPFYLTNLDLSVQQYFYSPALGWRLEREPIWDFIYRFGIFPGYLLAIACLLMIAASYWNNRLFKFRKASLIMVFALIIGPGLLVNAIFKDHWGRPRPRDVQEFGGKERYLPVCIPGSGPSAKSFPCGHASMGFYLAVPYLFLRRTRKRLAWSCLAVGTGYGFIIGVARMMAGGHFLSDVIWAGGVVWFAALIGYYLFRYDDPVETVTVDDTKRIKHARMATVSVGATLSMVTVGLVLATPYTSKKSFGLGDRELQQLSVIKADLKYATVEVVDGGSFQANYKVHAFGFPNSKVRYRWSSAHDTGSYSIEYMGWFTEVKNNIALKLPMHVRKSYRLQVEEGNIYCSLPDRATACLRLEVNKGEIHLKGDCTIALVGDRSRVVNRSGAQPQVFSATPQGWQGAVVEFKVPNGKLYVE